MTYKLPRSRAFGRDSVVVPLASLGFLDCRHQKQYAPRSSGAIGFCKGLLRRSGAGRRCSGTDGASEEVAERTHVDEHSAVQISLVRNLIAGFPRASKRSLKSSLPRERQTPGAHGHTDRSKPEAAESLPTEIPLADHSNDSQSKLRMRDRLRCDQRQHDRSATNQSGSVRSSR